MIDKIKLAKFIQSLESFIEQLESKRDLTVHRTINQSRYMQKCDELKILLVKLDEAQLIIEKLSDWINEEYAQTFLNWRKDVRWLNTYQQNREQVKPLL